MVKCSACKKEVGDWTVNGYGRCGPCEVRIHEAKNFPKEFELRSGDNIEIRSGGRSYFGKVITAQWWDVHTGWYIEIAKDHGGYGYWKQGCDGGTVRKLANATDPCRR